jgi:hypothetical protein
MNYFDQAGRDLWTLTVLEWSWLAVAALYFLCVPVRYALARRFPAPKEK